MASLKILPRLLLLLKITIEPTDKPVRRCSKVHASNIDIVLSPQIGSNICFWFKSRLRLLLLPV